MYGNYNSLGAYQSKESPYYSWYMFEEFPQNIKVGGMLRHCQI